MKECDNCYVCKLVKRADKFKETAPWYFKCFGFIFVDKVKLAALIGVLAEDVGSLKEEIKKLKKK